MDAEQKYLLNRNWVICEEHTWIDIYGQLRTITPKGLKVVKSVKMINDQMFMWN